MSFLKERAHLRGCGGEQSLQSRRGAAGARTALTYTHTHVHTHSRPRRLAHTWAHTFTHPFTFTQTATHRHTQPPFLWEFVFPARIAREKFQKRPRKEKSGEDEKGKALRAAWRQKDRHTHSHPSSPGQDSGGH